MENQKEALLEVDISCHFSGFHLDMAFRTKERRIGILGASGCGKSMTLKTLAGIVQPDRGRIAVNGRVLLDTEKKRNVIPQKRRVGYLFQNYALFPNMTVAQNIEAGLSAQRRGWWEGREEREQARRRVQQMMERFQLSPLAGRFPHELSGGQQQRTALARILISEPELLLLDEPFSALDGFLKDQMKRELKQLLVEYTGTMLLVSHSRDEIYEFSQELLVMEQGHIVESGRTRELFETPGYLETARLTGCRNLSAIERRGEHTIYAKDWGMLLQTRQEVKPEHTAVGIRAHDLRPAGEGDCNAFPMEGVELLESPFEISWLLKNRQWEQESCADPPAALWWKAPRIGRRERQGESTDEEQILSAPSWICLPEEALFLLRES